jgi:hypothetical protein
MPYKDPSLKREWERLHRPERLARRRELRRIEATRQTLQPEVLDGHPDGFPWPVIAIGGALAAANPWLGLGAGSLTLLVTALRDKDRRWLVVGALVVVISLLVLWLEGKGTNEGRGT